MVVLVGGGGREIGKGGVSACYRRAWPTRGAGGATATVSIKTCPRKVCPIIFIFSETSSLTFCNLNKLAEFNF